MIVKEIKNKKLIIVDDLHFGTEIPIDIDSSLLSQIIPKTIYEHVGNKKYEIDTEFAKKILTSYAKQQNAQINYNSISKIFGKDKKAGDELLSHGKTQIGEKL